MRTYKTYRWYPDALRRDYRGGIVVCAENLEEAREKARKAYAEKILIYWSGEDREVRRRCFERDISLLPPKIVENDVVFIAEKED